MTTTTIFESTLTAANIIDAASRETRTQLDSAVAADQTILLDHLNRTQLEIQRTANWEFLLSDWQYFVTQEGRTDYWITDAATVSAGSVQTGLALTDVDRISTVWDYSSARELKASSTPLISLDYINAAGNNLVSGAPLRYHLAPQKTGVSALKPLQLFPAPDDNNSVQAVPEAPILTVTAGGALSERKYYVVVTFVSTLTGGADGESTRSGEAEIIIPASQLLVVDTPVRRLATMADAGTLDKWNVYVSETEGSGWVKQNTSLTVVGTDWTEPAGGLIAGTAPPETNTLPETGGYLIGFRYWKERQTVTATADILQIPNVYRDVLIAGTCAYSMKYLHQSQEAGEWFQLFKDGLRQIVKDLNLVPGDVNFIRPGAVLRTGYMNK